MNSSEGINSIQVLTESWKYENTLFEKFDLEAFKSFSKSDNNDNYYDFAFSEQFAYDSTTYDRSIKEIQQIIRMTHPKLYT